MQPDAELEREWQARVQRLLEAAPEPDGDRLAQGMAAVRRRRARGGGSRLAWLTAAAIVAGTATAAAAWWVGREPAASASGPVEAAGGPERDRAGEQQLPPGQAEERSDDGTGHDGPVIYRRAR